MTIKELRKQLVGAIAMVVVAAIAVSSSTYAWFAVNTKVTASSMTITAEMEATFLQIASSKDAAEEAWGTLLPISPAIPDNLVLTTPLNLEAGKQFFQTRGDYDAYYAATEEERANEPLRSTVKTSGSNFMSVFGADTGTKDSEGNAVLDSTVYWGRAFSDDVANAAAERIPFSVTDVNGTEYQKAAMAIRVAPNSGVAKNVTASVKIESEKVQATDGEGNPVVDGEGNPVYKDNALLPSVRVLLINNDGSQYVLFDYQGNVLANKNAAGGNLAIELPSENTATAEKEGKILDLTAYFYIDGATTTAFTNNALNLIGMNAKFEFKAEE